MTILLFLVFAVIAALVTIGISFLIVDHIEFSNGLLRQRVLEGLWNTGYMGHAIFLITFLIEVGIAELFKNWFM
jgi:hypothetical protein